jgi:hypothetical protein
MLDIVLADVNSQTVHSKKLQASILWSALFVILMGLTSLLSLVMLRSGPSLNIIAWLIFMIGAVAIIIEPRYGVYLILFWGLMGDAALTPWFPFVKNMSSRESLLFLNDALIISPMETYMGLALLSWLGRFLAKRQLAFYTGPLFWPVMAFIAFITFGFLYGILTGGDFRIALWEGRAIFYLPIMLVLLSNLITQEKHAKNLIWFIVVALFLESLSGLYFIFVELEGDIHSVQAISEHSAAIHMNTFFLFALAVWVYKGSTVKRVLLPLMLPVIAIVYIAAQRRSAFLSLAVALAFMFIILYKENFRLFWLIVPPIGVMAILYLGVFWNSSGAIGLPAQAVKAIVAPAQASAADRSSDLYRLIENANINFTIHARPLTGVGFGNKFFMIIPLPDISFFEFWEYITHNSIMWIWMKSGIGGFVTMIFMVGMAIMTGVRVLWNLPADDMSAIVLVSVLYIVMHFLYAYVDMSWDPQSMMYVGAAMGIINSFARLESQNGA